jgi:hypothetical protein
VPEYISEFPSITDEQGETIRSRIGRLLHTIEGAPKSMKWKIRAKIGTRKIWYQEVAEKSDQF